MAQRKKNINLKFFENLVLDRHECLEWRGYKMKSGYGKMMLGANISALAHRFSYELFYGPIPPDHEVMHVCDNPPCVNPFHLTIGTHRENMLDMVAKDRHNKPSGNEHWMRRRPNDVPMGSRAGGAVLNEHQVIQIRQLYSQGWRRKELANGYGVSETCVKDIVRRETWKHI